jgi:predicted acetyltransferase
MPIRLQLATPTLERGWLERIYLDWLHELAVLSRATPPSTELLAREQINDWLQDRAVDLFVLRRDEEHAGFACVERVIGGTSRLREFYVVPSLRRLGVGSHAAALLFDRYAGPWQVEVLQSDRAALRFWGNVIQRYAIDRRREERADGHVRYVFPSRSAK